MKSLLVLFCALLLSSKNPKVEVNEILASASMGLFASPISLSHVNDEKNITAGFDFSRDKGKHETRAFYERNTFSSTDHFLGLTIKSSEHAGVITHDINKLWGDVTYFALLSYERKRETEIQTKEHEIRAGVLGFKYDIYEGDSIKDISLSYIPLFEYIAQNSRTADSTIVNEIYQRIITRNIRHSFRLRIRGKIGDKFKFSEVIFYRPATNLETKKTDFGDVDFENILKLSYEVTDKFSISVRNVVSWDVRRKTIELLPSTNIENKILFEYRLNL